MSLTLSNSKPDDLEVKTHSSILDPRGTVMLGDYEISFTDFLAMAWYVLTNTDLHGLMDPRIQFVQAVKKMEIVPGGDLIIDGKSIPTRKLSGDSLSPGFLKEK